MSGEWKAQYNKAGRLWFSGVDVQENPGGTPEARSHLCVCQASFLMTFATGGIPLAGSRHSAFFIVQLSHSYITTGKIIGWTRRTFVGKVMFLPFNMLSRFVITFILSSKHLLIHGCSHCLQWFRAPKIKVCHCFHCFPIYLPKNDGTGCHDPSFMNGEL